jgi:hypothetical protein
MNNLPSNQDQIVVPRILGLQWPYDDSEATNKFYVDSQIQDPSVGGGFADNLMLMGG